MIFSEFLKRYREGVNHRSGKALSIRSLSELLKVNQWRLQKWEQGEGQPKDESDRLAIKKFFGIEELKDDISEEVLSASIERYPHPARKKDEAIRLGALDGEVTDASLSGNEFINIPGGRFIMLMPKVLEYAYGGYLAGYRDPEYIDSLPKHSIVVNEKHRGKYIAFEMRGESMYSGEANSIEEKDIVIGRSIAKHYWTSKLHIHRYKEYIIVKKDGILVKQITEHDVGEGIIKIHSYNPDKEQYPDDYINLADVDELYNVVEITKSRR